MSKLSVAGLNIDSLTKKEFLKKILNRLLSQKKTFVTTPYSEFLYHALHDKQILSLLNQADFSVPDGIGIFWARIFLQIPLTAKNHFAKIFQSIFQAIYSGSAILLNSTYITKAFPEKIPGSELIWDLAEMASQNNFSIFLLGGFGETPKIVAQKLIEKYPTLKILGTSNLGPHDEKILDEIKFLKPDILLVAFGPIKQETWIVKNFPILPAWLAIGLGGTFDYIAKKRIPPPKLLRKIGLEWFWRLLTQPQRWKRILQAVLGLFFRLIKYKVLMSYTYRENAVCVITNKEGKILLCKRNPAGENGKIIPKFSNYWQFPQGGIDKDEEPIEAARREAYEETGIKDLEFTFKSPSKHNYLWDANLEPLFLNKKRYKGQTQQIFYFKFLGNDQEIHLDNLEFIDYKWVFPEELSVSVHEDRRSIIYIIENDLKHLP